MVWWIAAAGAAVSIGSQLSGGKKAKKAAKRAADNSWKSTLEQARRLENQQKENLSYARAQVAGSSGVKASGTAKMSLDYIEREQQEELDWLLESGRRAAREIRKGGQAAWYQSVLNSVSTGVNAYANYQQNKS